MSTSIEPSTTDPEIVEVRAALKAEAKRLKRLIDALARDLEKHGNPATLEAQGERLKLVFGHLKRGMSHVDVVDWEGQSSTIDLDPALDPRANLEVYFTRARKARVALARIEPRAQEARVRLMHIEEARQKLLIDTLDPIDLESARALLDRPDVAPSARRRAAKVGGRQPWRSFRVANDIIVRVGRGGADNDTLVKSARGHDLWLHARDQRGAHVVVPSRGEDIDPQVVLDAAHLAVHFSAARGERHVDVQTTRVKHLKKPGRGTPAGLVHVSNETVVHLRFEDERLARLLAHEVPA